MRIAAQRGNMLVGMTVPATELAVVNVRFKAAFVVWLAPTMMLTLLIVDWTGRASRGKVVGR